MQDKIRETLSDFKTALGKINFKSYDPCSKGFREAVNIGLMWHLLETLEEKDPVEEELAGAEKYFHDYKTTGDATYKAMAEDELRHAEILIKKAKNGMPGGLESRRIKEYEEEWREMSAKIKQ